MPPGRLIAAGLSSRRDSIQHWSVVVYLFVREGAPGRMFLSDVARSAALFLPM